MIGIQVKDEIRSLPDLLLHCGSPGTLVIGGGVVYMSGHHGPHIVDYLSSREEGLVPAHPGVVEEEKAPLPGFEPGRSLQ